MRDLVDVAARWWADRLETGDRGAFFEALRPLIGEAISVSCAKQITIEVDYDPCPLLLMALEAVGVDCRGFMFSAKGILPAKHRMYIRGGVVEVKAGYGAPIETIVVDQLAQPEDP